MIARLWHRLLHWWARHTATAMIRDFQRTFPGRCAVCSFRRYGILHGHVDHREMPTPHHCPEARA